MKWWASSINIFNKSANNPIIQHQSKVEGNPMKRIIVLIFLANLLLTGCTQTAKEQPTNTPVSGVDHAMQMLEIVNDVLFSMTESTGDGGAGGGGSQNQGEGEGVFSTALTLQELCTNVVSVVSGMELFSLT
ncbi:MAG: hypothetical protein N2C13_03880, partial [Chloroflexota bacterium]